MKVKEFGIPLIITATVVFFIVLFNAVKNAEKESVNITSEEWECTSASPKGLTTVCNNYHRKSDMQPQILH